MSCIFFDMEFNGLQQNTEPISLAMVSGTDEYFYAEFENPEMEMADWIKENVLPHTLFLKNPDRLFIGGITKYAPNMFYGYKKDIGLKARKWLSQFDEVELWGDACSYDFVLLVDILAEYENGYPKLPDNVFYLPFDITTFFKVLNIDPDINREEFVKKDFVGSIESCMERLGTPKEVIGKKHNALWDAFIVRECYNRLMRIK